MIPAVTPDDDLLRTSIAIDAALGLEVQPLPDCWVTGLTPARSPCWTCARLEVAGYSTTAGAAGVRYACAVSPLAPGLARCARWLREVGADDEAVPRRPRWPVVGTAH